MYVSHTTIGQNIKKARKEANLSQEEVARLMGISVLHYGHLERGTRPISLEMLAQLSSTLNCSFPSLLENALAL